MEKKTEKKLNNLLNGIEDSVKEQLKDSIEKAIEADVKKKVKKKMKQRRRKFIRRVVIVGAVAACGYLAYKKSDAVKARVDDVVSMAKDKEVRDKVKVTVIEKAEKVPELIRSKSWKKTAEA